MHCEWNREGLPLKSLSGRFVVGLAILAAGVIILLGNLEVLRDPDQYLAYWPVVLIALGAVWIVQALQPDRGFSSWAGLITGGFVLFLGVVYLGRNLDWFDFQMRYVWRMVWPALLILVGITLLRGRAPGPGGRTAFMGAVEMGGSEPWKLEGGSYTAMMGSVEMDLRAAEIPDGETLLDLTAIMGSIEIKVPRDVSIIGEGSAVLGGFTFLGQEDGGVVASGHMQRAAGDGAKTLRIQARSVMGSVEIEEV